MNELFVVMVPVMHCISYELEISWEKNFVAILRTMKSTKIFDLEKILGYTVVHIAVPEQACTGIVCDYVFVKI